MKTNVLVLLSLVFLWSCKTTSRRHIPIDEANTVQPQAPVIPHRPLDPNPDNTPQITNPPETIQLRFAFPENEIQVSSLSREIVFTIPYQTGTGAWNKESDPLVIEQGQTLKIVNSDSIVHRLHTDGIPCEHGSDILPRDFGLCHATSLYDPQVDKPLYDHNLGPEARFWLRVLPPLKKTLEDRCLSCHSGTRAQGGLDLVSWPPKSGSASLRSAFEERLAPAAPPQKKMPLGAELTEPERTTLLRWARSNFPKPEDGQPVDENGRSIRWLILRNQQIIEQGIIPPTGTRLSYPKDQTRLLIRLEERVGQQWIFLKEQEIVTNSDAFIIVPNRSPVQSLPKQLTIDSLFEFAQNTQMKRIEDFLLALPESLKRNYVLMRETQSRHLSSLQYPRLILFSDSAKILLGVSSHPADPLRETLEIAESLDDGSWKFREIKFQGTGPVLNASDSACQACHGSRPRPIWGSYPRWGGALGDEGGAVSPQEFDAIARLPFAADSQDRFGTLSFALRKEYNSFSLPKRSYAYPNTVFNMVLGRRASFQIYQTLKNSTVASKQLIHLLGSQECQDWPNREQAYQSWGNLVSATDLALHRSARETILPADRDWNVSTTTLEDLILFWRLIDLLAEDPALHDIFAPILAEMRDYALLSRNNQETTVDDPFDDFRPHQYLYPRVLGDELGSLINNPTGPGLSGQRREFCRILKLKL